MWLDTEARRLDVAGIVREARVRGRSVVPWGRTQIEVRDNDALLIAGRLVLELERQVVRPPMTGKAVEGPVLALCPRPGCGRRARVLWALPSDEIDVACRACAGVRYATASTSDEADRAAIALDRLHAKLGVAGRFSMQHRRYRQHAATYDRDARQLNDARARFEAASRDAIGRALGASFARGDLHANARDIIAGVRPDEPE